MRAPQVTRDGTYYLAAPEGMMSQTPVMPAAAPTAPHTPYMVPMPPALQPVAVVHQQEIPKLPRHQGAAILNMR